jgi:type IV pilus assembly protein PilB
MPSATPETAAAPGTGPSPVARQELEESARIYEMMLEVNPEDAGALDGLAGAYAALGESDKLDAVRARLAALATAPAPEPPPAAAAPAALTTRPRRIGRLGDLLVSYGLISQQQLDRTLADQRGTGERLGRVLVRQGAISDDQLVGFLSRQYGIPSINPAELEVPREVLALVPVEVARKHQVLPVKRTGDSLVVAVADPTNVATLDDIAFMTNLQVAPLVASEDGIARAIDRLYTPDSPEMDEVVAELEVGDVEVVDGEDESWSRMDVFELKESADEAPVVRLVNMILVQAIRQGASDIHLEPFEKSFRVRFRVDGMLREVMKPAKKIEAAVTSRIKIMANLDIAERRVPQDGRIKLRYGGREIDFRVSTLPTIFGESTVLRILDKNALQLDLTMLGFDPWSLEQFTRAIRQPYGMILITGPTGSGKTTTLYSAIHTVNSPDVKILTVEDPVEYNLAGVNQVQVNDQVGRSFAAALRSFLRQDPDVILVGETRDLETAQIGIRAALTGHLVLSTLHTNDCPSTVARLLDMGVPPFLVASALSLVVAQRLGRKVCKDCREGYEIAEEELLPLGHVPRGQGRLTLQRGRGCPTCAGTGMKGRVAIYEVMPVGEELRGLVLRNAPTAEIRELALSQGMRTLRQSALQKVLDGVMPLEEVLRVTVG